jgi:hypothetical protein
MAKPKSIYPLKGIFTSLLRDTDKNNFLIPTYQRGYKWSSGTDESQVDVLLRDLFNAYEAKNGRYYLQFLTLKEKDDELEVIDGQQRLTTLSIIFCILFYRLGKNGPDNFVIDRLKYQTRQNFIEKFIYNNIKSLLDSSDWEAFTAKNPQHDNQDVFYIFKAVITIECFLDNNVTDINGFREYISSEVYLIINLLDENLNSEKIFVNVNKGVNLNDEDLVKGLLITKLPLDLRNQKNRATEVEINEIRTNLGRQWDDLSNWAQREDIRVFFKSENMARSRLDWLIRFTFPEVTEDASGHPMFNHFDKLYSRRGSSAQNIFQSLRRTKMMLNDWFNEPEIGNLLGFLLSAKNGPRKESLLKEIGLMSTKTDMLGHLKSASLSLLPVNADLKLRELNYEDNPTQLFNVFLILDIMKFLPIGTRKASVYDFTKIVREDWSLEHIFPQNAKDFKGIRHLSLADLEIMRELLDKDIENLKADTSEESIRLQAFHQKLLTATEGFILEDEDKVNLVSLLRSNASELHTIGNLALLERNMNSSLSNHYFNRKREILVKKISEGKFVPYHTYDVFSKLIISNTNGLQIWSKDDIIAHTAYINGQIKEITTYLTPQI